MPTQDNSTIFNTPFAQLFKSVIPGISPASTFQTTIPATSSFYQPPAATPFPSPVATFSPTFANLTGQPAAPVVTPLLSIVIPPASPPPQVPSPELSPFARLFESLTGRPLITPTPAPVRELTPFERLFASLVTPTPRPVPPSTPVPVPPITPPLPIPQPVPVPAPLPIPAVPVIPIVGTGNGLLAEYYNNNDRATALVSRVESSVDFNWNAGSPDSRINPDNFSARWSGEVQARFNEEYTFFATADESIKLTIDGKTIVELLTTQTTQERSGKITLEAGKKYTLQLDYQENLGNALASLAWSSTNQAKQIIPKNFLYTNSAIAEVLPIITLKTPAAEVRESDGFARMRIDRSGNFNLVSTITYTTNNGSAQEGSDYTTTAGTVTFNLGEATKFVDIPILNDLIAEATETFGFNVGATTGAIAGVARSAIITILDDDAPGTIEFSRKDFVVAEDGIVANLTITRGGNTAGIATVNYATSNGDALAGSDYVTKAGTVTFADGETSKNITITILNDNIQEINEFFNVTLNNASGSATLGLKTIAEVTIIDDDGQPVKERYIGNLVTPIAFKWIPGTQTMFIAEKGGTIKVANGNVLQTALFLDFRPQINSARDRGLMDIALHPQFGKGTNQDYLYLLYVNDFTGPGQAVTVDDDKNRNARVTRVRAQNINGVWSAIPNSEEIIVGKNSTWENINSPNSDSTVDLNIPPSGIQINPDGTTTNLADYIAVDSQSHAPGTIVFGPDGNLYVTVGDGTSYYATDPRTARGQDIGNLSGKVLRIDPETGEGLGDNPFWDGDKDSNQSKVFALGVRNGFRAVFAPGPTGKLLVADVGWNTSEEINIVNRGDNFGWPWFEGNDRTGGYQNLPGAVDFYASGQATRGPAYTYLHDGKSSAIVAGDYYTGLNPIWQNSVFVTDVAQGWVKALTFDANGIFQRERTVATGANAQQYLVDMNMGADGNMYYASLITGEIGRFLLG